MVGNGDQQHERTPRESEDTAYYPLSLVVQLGSFVLVWTALYAAIPVYLAPVGILIFLVAASYTMMHVGRSDEMEEFQTACRDLRTSLVELAERGDDD